MNKIFISLGFYRIEYSEIIQQTKHLISKEAYLSYKSLKEQKHDLEINTSNKKKKEKEYTEKINEINILLSPFSDPFFVVDSPMYDAIKTGIITIDPPSGNAGSYPVKIIKI